MRLESVSIKNFRCYLNEITVSMADLTTFVGKNDIGKSSVLEALEIFFNNDTVKIEQGDANIYSGDPLVSITCEFSDLPDKLTLDAGADTTLAAEYLLSSTGTLKIQKIFDCGKKTPSSEVFILANHPTAAGVADLLDLKEKDLQKLVKEQNLDIALKGNPGMRQALWAAVEDLNLREVPLPVSKPKEDSKRIWDQLENYLPMYALFQSDRSSRDSDGEVQNPMKAAVAAAIAEVQEDINRIQAKVQEKAEQIAASTHDALKTIDPGLAKELTPQFTPPTPAKWTGLFSVGMDTDDGIPLNKRGSGVRRLVLVSFFKAEAERRLKTGASRSIIYAIEEPETAQHPNNQRILIDSFKTLASETGCQVLLTTHSPGFASELPTASIRFVTRADGRPVIQEGADVFGQVAETLGVIPDSRVRVLFCVEGPTDVLAFKHLSRALHEADNTLPDLSKDDRIAFVLLGGSTLKHWVTERYLRALNRVEVHIYDNDVPKYAASVAEVNKRGDGSWATLTSKHEIECYLHADAIRDAFDVNVAVADNPDAEGKAVPRLFAEAFFAKQKTDAAMSDTKAKLRLAEKAFPKMTAAMVTERDPAGEVAGWFRRIGEMM
ncbi:MULTISPECIES: ATP-binding protein [Burkholderia]|uniref:Putative ATP-dependent endonuclease of OLD family n=1 Tax=Burkholderia pyrrocinia TaxID=60550 RepID=A0A318ITY7_BURPY|nr:MULTISPECIES: ATP-binding protein [Burkholderia]PXX32339.1 putative ATP-dependent endonuclease of OLD family [Burkholderia pyrrocinia]SFW44945.1 Predicted ATP-dependent endonuclease of the OLD family, contains P-loop ATPase and TOPRIM domains [Burkholderia sp. NFACC33-1]SFX78244.1 Predicted ATP-dependent endonuclease of the OLD family, contains P-loop ATPase and TOPRIM domains [Burkholderia sp. NFPP32]